MPQPCGPNPSILCGPCLTIGISVLIAALAVLALAVGLFTTHVQPAHAQDATITSLLSRLDAGFPNSFKGTTTVSEWDTTLKSGDFEGLSGMGELVLADNSLSELPEGVFDGLSSLRRERWWRGLP